MTSSPPRAAATAIDKIWDRHEVADLGHDTALLYIDRIVMHERTGGRTLESIFKAGRKVLRPALIQGTFDHIIDTDPGRTDQTKFSGGPEFIRVYRETMRRAGIPLFEIDDPRQGIAHVIAPELGIALPGATLVCADSHTCTVGGIGALAWGVGVTQNEHALVTQTLRQRRMRRMRIRLAGAPPPGVVAKDLVLALIARYGAAGGEGYVAEFAGSAVAAMPVEGRMTLCNMAVEFGLWTALVAPDDVTFQYLHDRPYAPKGERWDQALAHWRTLPTDPEAVFDAEIDLDGSALAPQITWGTSPEHAMPVDGRIPDPAALPPTRRSAAQKALAYTGAMPGQPLLGTRIDAAFIGSCTNARLSDLEAAAAVLRGRRVAAGVRALCVPGSTSVKRAAEAAGLHRVFIDAGFEWRESGCSLCFFVGGDSFGDARRVVTSTNRNFENRQGPGVISHLASPATVAASAIAGSIADVRPLLVC